MGKNIYVGNLVWDATDDDLIELFNQFGPVLKAQVVNDRETGRSRGFGFVEMQNEADVASAVQALNNTPYRGRNLTVNEARPREEGRSSGGGPRRPAGGGGGYGGGGGLGGGRGGNGGYGGSRGGNGGYGNY